MKKGAIEKEIYKVDKMFKDVERFQKLGNQVDKSPAQVSKHSSKRG